MFIYFLFFWYFTKSKIPEICLCKPDECPKACQPFKDDQKFEVIESDTFEQFIVEKYSLINDTVPDINVYVTFSMPLEIKIHNFQDIHVSFYKYFQNVTDSNEITIRLDLNSLSSHSKFTFSETNLIISSTNQMFVLDFIEFKDNSRVTFEGSDAFYLTVKCCILNENTYSSFEEVSVSSGFCQNDFYLESDSIQSLQFFHKIENEFERMIITINGKTRVDGAKKMKIVSTSSDKNLSISASSKYSTLLDSELGFPDSFNVSISNFSNVFFSDDNVLSLVKFDVENSKNIFCNSSNLTAQFSNTNVYFISDAFVSGSFDNASLFSFPENKYKICVSVTTVSNQLNIMSSYIDLNVDYFVANSCDPITFCIGDGGISKVKIDFLNESFESEKDALFSNLNLNRDFSSYLPDEEISSFLNQYNEYLQIKRKKKYKNFDLQNDDSIKIHFVDDSALIHGFSNDDSILSASEISEDPEIFAVFFQSPNKAPLNLCLSEESYESVVYKNGCFQVNNLTMNNFLTAHAGVENIIINVKATFNEGDCILFDSFHVNNLTITADPSSKVYGTFNFNGKVTSNLTLIGLKGIKINIIPKAANSDSEVLVNVDNISIFDCDIGSINSEYTEKVSISNFSLCQNIKIPSSLEIDNLIFFTESSLLASNNVNSLFIRDFGFVDLSLCNSINVFILKKQENSEICVFVNASQLPNYHIHVTVQNTSLLFYEWDELESLYKEFYDSIIDQITEDQITEIDPNKQLAIYHSELCVNAFLSSELPEIPFIGTGHVSTSPFFRNSQTFSIDPSNGEDQLDLYLKSIYNEEVFVTIPNDQSRMANLNVKLSSLHDKIVHFQNLQPNPQTITMLEKTSISEADAIGNFYRIDLAGIKLILAPILGNLGIFENLFKNIVLGDVFLDEDSSLYGFIAEKITFHKLKCTFDDIYSLVGNILIKEQLILSGKISQNKEVTVNFNSKSLLNITLNENNIKILLDEKMVKIGSFTFLGVDHVSITLASSGFNCEIEPVQNESGNTNFDAFPKVTIIQSTGQSKAQPDEMIRPKIANKIDEINNNRQIKTNNKSKLHKPKHPNYPSKSKNEIHLIGDWNGCKARFSFENLGNVDFYTESEVVPFHFISTIGNVVIYLDKEKTDFLGDFLYSNVQKSPYVSVIYKKSESEVTFCGSFGGLTDVHFKFYQPGVYAHFHKLSFEESNLLSLHLYMSVEGHSFFSIDKGSSNVNNIFYFSFNCTCELDDPKIEELVQKECIALGLFNDEYLPSRIISSWELAPQTVGIYESFVLYFSKSEKKLVYVMKQNPYNALMTLCVSESESCDINLESETDYNDIRPFIPRGIKNIYVLIEESFDTPLNLDYDELDNFSFFFVGFGLMDMNIKLGFNHVSELHISSALVSITDDNYSIEKVHVSGNSKIKNINGIKKLEFDDIEDFKLNKIQNFTGIISIPSNYDQIVFQPSSLLLKRLDEQENIELNFADFPNIELKLYGQQGTKSQMVEFLIDDGVDDDNLQGISVNFNTKITVVIGQGWERISQKLAIHSFSNLYNVDKIKTESFPYHAFAKLITSTEVSNGLVPIYANQDTNSISVNSAMSLIEGEQVIFYMEEPSNQPEKVSFDAIEMKSGSSIQLFNQKEENDFNIQIGTLIVEKNSSASLSGVAIDKELVLNRNSVLRGKINFNEKSVIVLNGKARTKVPSIESLYGRGVADIQSVDFPTLIFDEYSNSIPSKILINFTEKYEISDENNSNRNNDEEESDNDDNEEVSSNSFGNDDNHGKGEESIGYDEENPKKKSPKYFYYDDEEITKDVVISNIGFNCDFWLSRIELKNNYNFDLNPKCENGFLIFTLKEVPGPTPYHYGIPDFARPTMTPIPNGKRNVDEGLPKSFIFIIVVAAIFLSVIFALLIVVVRLKKKYRNLIKIPENDNEDDNNDVDDITASDGNNNVNKL